MTPSVGSRCHRPDIFKAKLTKRTLKWNNLDESGHLATATTANFNTIGEIWLADRGLVSWSLRKKVALNALIICMIMIISNVCPKAVPDLCPPYYLLDIQIPICGKSFWMATKCCLKYYYEIFTDHIFSVFETAWPSQTNGLCFVCLFWVTRAFFWTWAGCVARGIIILKHPVHVQQGWQMILNVIYDKCMGVQNPFFSSQCIWCSNVIMQTLSTNLLPIVIISDIKCIIRLYAWFLPGIRSQLW